MSEIYTVIVGILGILAAQGVSLAFPSRSLYVASTAPAKEEKP